MLDEIDPTVQLAIDAATDRAVERTFAILGVDVHDPSSVEEFREDLRFGKGLRRAKEKGLLAVVTAVGTAVVFAVWQGAVTLIQTGK